MIAAQVAERERIHQWLEWMGLGFCRQVRSPPDDPEELRCAIIETVQCLNHGALECVFCIVAALALPREEKVNSRQ